MYDTYRERSYEFDRVTKHAFKYLSSLQGRIIDLGSGDGALVNHLTTRSNVSVTGYELYGKWNTPYIVRHDLNQSIPEKDASVDTIFALGIIHYIHDPCRFLNELARVLKQTGHVVLTIPNLAFIVHRLTMFWSVRPATPLPLNKHVTEWFFFPIHFERMLMRHFRIEKKYYNKGIIPLLRKPFPIASELTGDTTYYLLTKRT